MTLTEFLLARIGEDEAAARDTGWLAFEYGVDSAGREAFAARVLAECEAKRRIVEQAIGIAEVSRAASIEDLGGEQILRLLALPHADHPDYRKEWRPNG